MNKLLYYAYRLKQLGFKQGFTRITHKISSTTSYYRLKYNLLYCSSPTTVTQFYSRFNLKNITTTKKQLSTFFLDKLFAHPDFFATIPESLKDKATLFTQANAIVKKEIQLFGPASQPTALNWHQDSSVPQQPWSQLFYRDIKIITQKSNSIDDYHPDIKVPWELSRMHQAVILGLAYDANKATNPDQANKYAQAFEEQTLDWINNNKYLYGVNWVCPMDVAIRATNLLWAFYFFKDSASISNSFLEQLLCSLYDHSRYLERNWETSATPNNHYIADLIGYDYLCSFFAQLDPTISFKNKKKETVKRLLEQFELQVLPDGTQYEGSVSYHRLVLEFYLHFYYLNYNQMEKLQTERLIKMLNFAQATSINKKEFIQIGDTDSGKLVFGIELKPLSTNQTLTYKEFGIGIIKNDRWLISHRTSIKNAKQPSGHFHEDNDSITMSIDQQPIIVDPGSYLYTANSFARNLFRSETMHNGPQLYKKNGTHLESTNSYNLTEQDLFQLPQNNNFDYTTKRMVTVAQEKNQIELQDFCYLKVPSNNLVIAWNFLFSPDIGVQAHHDGWIIQSKNIKLIMNTTFKAGLTKSYYATQYGSKESCWSLSGQEPVILGARYITTIQLITSN